MKLMRKGEEMKYVPDSNVMAMRKLGYICEGEVPASATANDNASSAVSKSDSAPVEGGTDAVSAQDDPATAQTPKEQFACPQCGKQYASAAALKRHMADKHSE